MHTPSDKKFEEHAHTRKKIGIWIADLNWKTEFSCFLFKDLFSFSISIIFLFNLKMSSEDLAKNSFSFFSSFFVFNFAICH